VIEELHRFVSQARWFGGKGREFTVTRVRRAGVLPDPHLDRSFPGVAIDLVEVTYADDGGTELYQVPLAFRPEEEQRLNHAHVGAWDDADFGPSQVYDAVHDRDAMELWLRAFDAEAGGTGDHRLPLAFHRLTGHDLDVSTHSTLFSGEQSNSSVAFGEDALMKVFRKVTPGVNPDVQVHDVLTRAGSDHVASLYGWLDVVDEDSDAVIQLAMLQQFLRTASDGWELALNSVRNLFTEADLHAYEVGGDFASESARLGTALAETHATLAEHFPTQRRTADEMAQVAAHMRARLDEALAAVPDLAAYADRLGRIFDRVGELDGVEVQRIHGDLHLGQTLRTVRGWKLVDFEGEPARPLHERLLPDSVWRDVAGMLRSFDYAAAVTQRQFDDGEPEGTEQRAYRATEWTERNRAAFVEAYTAAAPVVPDPLLLDAYEADKAVYECMYEARNRPGWVTIPLAAVARLVA
jgi:maltokinase